MSGSPPQMETIGASHSTALARQSSNDIMSLSLVEYSRMRPQPVHVKLHVCSGSSCRTTANFGVRRSLCLMMCRAIFAVSANGNRISLSSLCYYWYGRLNRIALFDGILERALICGFSLAQSG